MMKSFVCATTCNLTRWLSATQKMFCSLGLLFLLTAMTGQNVMAYNQIYVDASATGLNNGKSWANAYTSLETAIAADIDYSDIRVAGGIYRPTIQVGGTGPRYAAFKMKYGVSIYGGYNAQTGVQTDYFPGGENETILSGDIGVIGNASDNCYHVVHNPDGLNLNTNSRLMCLTISGGNANYNPSGTPHMFRGGGVYNGNSSNAHFYQCVFSNNSAGYGGGIFFINANLNYLENCTFVDNRAISNGSDTGYGAGIFVTTKAVVSFHNCLIINNSADATGGGIYVYSNSSANASSVTIINCTIANNHANYCGGIRLWNYSSALIINSIIWGNTHNVSSNGRQIAVTSTSKTTDIDNGFMLNSSKNNTIQNGTNDIDMHDINTYMTRFADPQFVNPANLDFRIFGSSPCVGYGANGLLSNIFDIRLQPRDQDRYGDTDNNDIDNGAYEYTLGVDPPNQNTPCLTTQKSIDIGKYSAAIKGNISFLGGLNASQHGHCWSTTSNPTIYNFASELGPKNTIGDFTTSMTSLYGGTKYYVRSYITNSNGTFYGPEINFTTSDLAWSPYNLQPFTKIIVEVSNSQKIWLRSYTITQDIKVTAPDGFEISTSSDAGYTNNFILRSDLIKKGVYFWVRMISQNPGDLTGEIAFMSGSITVAKITVTGTVAGPPSITSFTPVSGFDGEFIEITGSNFIQVNTVSFGGIPASSFLCNSSNLITARVGKGASGDVLVTALGGTATKPGFTFLLPPVINATGTLNSFSTERGANSESQSITVSGSNLTGNIYIYTPNGFEISTTAESGYTSSLILKQIGGTVAATTIYVRMAYYASGNLSDNIQLSSTGVDNQFLAISGTVTETVTSVSVPENNVYRTLQNLDFTINCNSAIIVTGMPYIRITLGTGGGVNASYYSGSGTNALIFRYTIANGNADADGISLGSSIVPNGGYLQYPSGVNASLTLNNIASTSYVRVDAIAPTVTITSTSSATTSVTPIPVTITFSESVSGFVTGELTVTNGTAGNISGSGTTYTANITPSGPGTVTVNIAASVALDAAGNSNTAATQLSRIYTMAPTVTTNAASSITTAGATLNGSVNANNASTAVSFQYGTTTTNYGSTVTAEISPVTGLSSTTVSKVITGLASNTTYYYRVKCENAAGTSYGAHLTFITLAIAPSAITNTTTGVTPNGATLNGSINANNASTTVTFEYGTTISYGSTITAEPSSATGTSLTAVSKAITDLTPNTLYHFRVKGVNAGGTTIGLDQTFTTTSLATLTVSGTLSPFASCQGSNSSEQSFSVSGSNLTGNISLSAPNGFEISKTSGSTFSGSLTLIPSGGTVPVTTIYVRMQSSATGSPSGSITVTSNGATDRTIAVSGAVTTPVVPSFLVTAVPATRTVCAGSPVTLTASDANNDLTFDGTNDFVNLGDINELDGASQFTIETMVYATSSSAYKTIFSKRVDHNNKIQIYFGSSGQLTFALGNVNVMEGSMTTPLLLNNWNHIAAIYNASGATNADKMKIYLNGVQKTLTFSGTMPASITANSKPALIGSEIESATACFAGKMNDFRIWNIARSDAQISASSNNCLSGSTTGLIAEYKFNEATGNSIAQNSQGTGYDGALVNMNTATAWNTSASGCKTDLGFSWSDGITNGTSFVPSKSGTYTLTATSANACNVASQSVDITVHPRPVPAISGNSTVLIGSTGNVYTTEASMTGYTWSVSAGGTITSGGTSTSNTATITWNTAGPQTVGVNYTSSSCTGISPTLYNVTVSIPPPVVTLAGTMDPFAYCAGSVSQEQSFIVSGSNLTGNISLSAPAGFEISTTSGDNFSGDLVLPHTGGTVSTTTIYVSMQSSATGSPSGSISVISNGATDRTVAVSGVVTTPVTPSFLVTSVPSSPILCSGGPVTLTASDANNDLTFDGTDDYVNLGDINELDGASQFTIEAMVYATSSSTYKTIFSKRVNHSQKIQLYFGASGKLSFDIGNGDYLMTSLTNTVIPLNTWVHLAAVYNGAGATNADKMKIYLNGVLATLTFSGTIPASTAVNIETALIGSESTIADPRIRFAGKMNDFRIWNTARTTAQISASSNNCLSGATSGLIAEYKFNEATGSSIAQNSNGSGYHGTLVNMNASTAWNLSTSGCATSLNFSWTNGITNGVSFVPAGTATYTVTASSAGVCNNTASKSVEVTVLPKPVPTISGNATVNVGSTGNVYTTEASMTGYTWSVSAGGTITSGGTSTNNTVTITWNTGGDKTVGISYTNATGCTASSPTVYNLAVDVPPPSILSFSPSSGGTGTTITILGSNFTGATAVSFGGTAANSFSVVNGTSITAVVGAGTSGIVSVTTPNGTDTEPGFIFIPTWSGTTNNDWNNADNWIPQGVPGASANVIIRNVTSMPIITASAICNNITIEPGAVLIVRPGKTLTVTGTLTNNSAGGIIIESNATGTGSLITGAVAGTGTAITQSYMTTGRWHLVSAPVIGQAIKDFLIANDNVARNGTIRGMMDYNPVTNSWNSYFTDETSGSLGGAKGFSMRSATNNIVVHTAPLLAGDFTASGLVADKWNCVGNPYSSAIGINTLSTSNKKFITENASNLDADYGAVYIWEQPDSENGKSGRYTTVSNVPTPGSGVDIQQGQAFMIKMRAGQTSLTFTPSMQFHGPALPLKSTDDVWPTIKLTATASGLSGSTIIAFNNSMTKGLDPTYDAGLLKGGAELLVYTKLVEDNGIPFAIQALPDSYEGLVIPVGLECKSGGEVTFSAKRFDLPAGFKVILEDKLKGTFTDLSSGNYKVTVEANAILTDRFALHASAPVQTSVAEEILTGKLEVWAVSNIEIRLKGQVGSGSEAMLYDVLGRKVLAKDLDQGSFNVIATPNLKPGVYLLWVKDNGKAESFKILIRE